MSTIDVIFILIGKELDKLDLTLRCDASIDTRTIRKKKESEEWNVIKRFLEDFRIGMITVRGPHVYVTTHPSLMEDHIITVPLSDPQLIEKIIAHVTITLDS